MGNPAEPCHTKGPTMLFPWIWPTHYSTVSARRLLFVWCSLSDNRQTIVRCLSDVPPDICQLPPDICQTSTTFLQSCVGVFGGPLTRRRRTRIIETLESPSPPGGAYSSVFIDFPECIFTLQNSIIYVLFMTQLINGKPSCQLKVPCGTEAVWSQLSILYLQHLGERMDGDIYKTWCIRLMH